MFTGIIEMQGTVEHIEKADGGMAIIIEAPGIAGEAEIGGSIAVNGACLTVVAHDQRKFTVQLVEESIRRTTFGILKAGDTVNLERTLRLSDRIDGHLVQGHVDGFGRITEKEHRGNSIWYTLEIPDSLLPYIVEKGSIALDGISLTIAALTGNMCAVAIIPHTAEITTFGKKEIGEAVNVEVDMLGKYVESLLQAGRV